MTPFGYTMLGFGGGKNEVPIAEDLTYSEVTDIPDVQDDLWMDLDPWNKNRIIVVYRDDGTYGNDTQIVCGNLAADGNSVTWGTVVEYDDEYGDIGFVRWDSQVENSFIILARGRNGNVQSPEAHAGTVSGTTITLGTKVNLSFRTASDYMNNIGGLFNPAQAGQVVQVNGNYDGSVHRAGEIKIITVSGTTVTHVSSADFEAGETGNADVHWDKVTANKGYISYSGITTYPCVRPFTMSGNTVTLGTKHIINSYTCGEYQAMCTMETGGRVVSMYKDGNDLRIKVGNDDETDESGDTITKKYYPDFNFDILSSDNLDFKTKKSVKSLREYQLGIVFGDKYGQM